MPLSGSPTAGSYSQPHVSHTYFFIMFLFLVINKIISYVDYLSSATCIASSHGLLICQVQRAEHPRTKAKVHVSHKGWRTVFRFVECNVQSILARKQKCVSAIRAGARSLDLLSANICINLYITKYFCVFLTINLKKTDFRSMCRLTMMKNIIIGVQ